MFRCRVKSEKEVLDEAKQDVQAEEEIRLEEKTPEELFAEFFLRQNGFEMSEEQQDLVRKLWGSESRADCADAGKTKSGSKEIYHEKNGNSDSGEPMEKGGEGL